VTPTNVKLHQISGILELTYDDGLRFDLSAEYLRVHSPSAEVQGHSPSQAVLQEGKKHVKIADLEPQGHYAIKIIFSDGHNSGIFSWSYLHELGSQHEQKWASYLDKLASAGKSREPRFIAVS
jgi:DUF971 family protein